jgi:hypothetical protein
MNNQPDSPDQSNQTYQQSEIFSQPSSPGQPEQGYQQREMADQPYPFGSTHRGYRHPSNLPGPGYQLPPYQGNQVSYGGQNDGTSNDMIRMSDMGAMQAESHYTTYRDALGNLVESRRQVFEDQNQIRANIRYWTSTIVYFLLAVLEIILLLRLLFRLLGANEYTSFITFLYGLSHPFVVAFTASSTTRRWER